MSQGITFVACPGITTLIDPAQLHMSLQVLFNEGWLLSMTVGEPTIHGAGVTGMQGIGVSTPIAADVAEATAGLARLVHIPKGMMFTIGLWSIIFAAGWLPDITRFSGKTTNELGATPNEHMRLAPLHTCIPILIP